MFSTSDFKRGLKIEIDGQPYIIVEFENHRPGKGAAVVRTKLKNLLTGQTIDPTFRSGDKVARPDIMENEVDFLYEAGGVYNFMDPSSYEQYEVSTDILGDAINFMTENLKVSMLFYKGKPINVDLPNHVVLEVVECDPAVRGDTVQGATKPAKLQTGFTVHVPLFINEGEKLRIDTRTGDYIERA